MADYLRETDDETLLDGLNGVASPVIEELLNRGYEVQLSGTRFSMRRGNLQKDGGARPLRN